MTMPQRHGLRPPLNQKLLRRIRFGLLRGAAPRCAGNRTAAGAADGLPQFSRITQRQRRDHGDRAESYSSYPHSSVDFEPETASGSVVLPFLDTETFRARGEADTGDMSVRRDEVALGR